MGAFGSKIDRQGVSSTFGDGQMSERLAGGCMYVGGW